MFKKWFFAVGLVMITMCSFIGAAFAGGAEDVIFSKQTKPTEQFLVTITRPDSNESTFRKSYVICGNTRKNNIKVKLLVLNKNTDTYELFENTDGESSWDVGSCGVFMKEVGLPSEGSNNIRIVAYDKYEFKKLVAGKNMQVSDFSITLLNNNIKDKIKNRLVRFSDMLYKMFD